MFILGCPVLVSLSRCNQHYRSNASDADGRYGNTKSTIARPQECSQDIVSVPSSVFAADVSSDTALRRDIQETVSQDTVSRDCIMFRLVLLCRER
eukprot:5565348-Pyramimonas_sp.AAC.1